MKDLKTMLTQPLAWEFSKKKITLKSNGDVLLKLREEKKSRASFEFDGKDYMVFNDGFWNPKTVITENGKPILILKRSFLGSKGRIEMANEKHYECRVRNSPLVKISFFLPEGKEILNYKLDAKRKPRTQLTLLFTDIPDHDLIFLIVLGCYSFRGIVKENDNSNLITMTAAAGGD